MTEDGRNLVDEEKYTAAQAAGKLERNFLPAGAVQVLRKGQYDFKKADGVVEFLQKTMPPVDQKTRTPVSVVAAPASDAPAATPAESSAVPSVSAASGEADAEGFYRETSLRPAEKKKVQCLNA